MKDKILFIAPTPPPYAGPEISSRLLLSSCLDHRFRIRHLRSNVSNTNREKGKIGVRKIAAYIPFFIKLIFYLIKERPKLVYSLLAQNRTGFVRDAIIIMVCRLFGKKIVVHLRGGNFANFYTKSSPVFRKFISKVLNSVDILLLLGKRLKEQFVSIFPERKIRVLYNAVNVKDFNGNSHKATTDYEGHDISVLYVGHLSYAKGFCDLLKAIPLVLEKEPKTRFVFAGERTNGGNILYNEITGDKLEFRNEDIDRAIDDMCHRFPSQLQFLGLISGETKVETFLNADIFVLPSYSEGFPVVVLEAMAGKLPIVTTPVGALPEVFDDGLNGFFIQPGDYRDLADKMIRLVTDSETRTRTGQYNFEYVSENFDIDVIAGKLGDIFSEMTNGAQRKS